MEVKQIYTLVNNVTNEVLGKTDLINEDLSNVVDLGTEIYNANAVDNYVGIYKTVKNTNKIFSTNQL